MARGEKKRGRPNKSESKDHKFSFRCTDEEYKDMINTCVEFEIPMSSYAREAMKIYKMYLKSGKKFDF